MNVSSVKTISNSNKPKMEKLIAHIAHNNDLYEFVFYTDGRVDSVMLYPDNNGQAGQSLVFWKLPQDVREKIRNRVAEFLP